MELPLSKPTGATLDSFRGDELQMQITHDTRNHAAKKLYRISVQTGCNPWIFG